MSDITYIGVTDYQNQHIRFGVKRKDRGGHIYCIGKTGVGKSTLLLNMAISDIEQGNGIGIFDPHGDIAEALLAYIPQERINDVLYFNASDIDCPIAFNPLANTSSNDHHIIASNLIATFKKIWADSWGPRLEHVFRNAILSLLQYPNATLLDIQPLLTNATFRSEVMTHIKDSALLNFWHTEFNPLSPHMKQEYTAPIINKIGLLQTHPHIKHIVGQTISSFDVSDIMNNQKIFIANLSKGVLGEDATQLLGSMLVTEFQSKALSRATIPEKERNPFYLYIDEMQSFVTLSFADILAESRKYGLSLFLAHQYIHQLHESIRNAVFGNVGTMIAFRVGATDAKILEQEFAPVFNQQDLTNLPRYHIYLKLLIDGTSSKPFSAITLPLKKTGFNYTSAIIQKNKANYEKIIAKAPQRVQNTEETIKNEPTLFEM